MLQASRQSLETFLQTHSKCRWCTLKELCKEQPVDKSFVCGKCDVCKLPPPPIVDFTREVKFLLEVLKAGGATDKESALPWCALIARAPTLGFVCARCTCSVMQVKVPEKAIGKGWCVRRRR